MRVCDFCGTEFEAHGNGLVVQLENVVGPGIDDTMCGDIDERDGRRVAFDLCRDCRGQLRTSLKADKLLSFASTMVRNLVQSNEAGEE